MKLQNPFLQSYLPYGQRLQLSVLKAVTAVSKWPVKKIDRYRAMRMP
jgi:hypothetical protein